MRLAISAVAAVSGLFLLALAFYGRPAVYLRQAWDQWDELMDRPVADRVAVPDGGAEERATPPQQDAAPHHQELAVKQEPALQPQALAVPLPTPPEPVVRPQLESPTPAPLSVGSALSAAVASAPLAPAPAASSPPALFASETEASRPTPPAPADDVSAMPAPSAIQVLERHEPGIEPATAVLEPTGPEPSSSQQAKSEQAKSERAKSDQAKSDQAKSEQAKPEHARSGQVRPEPPKPEQTRSEQAKPEPPRAEPSKPAPRVIVAQRPPPAPPPLPQPPWPQPSVQQPSMPQPSPPRLEGDDTQSVLARLRQLAPAAAPTQQADASSTLEPRPRPAPSPWLPRLSAARAALANGQIEDARRLLQQVQLQLVFGPVDAPDEAPPTAGKGAVDIAHALDALSANDVPLSRRYIDLATGDLSGSPTNAPIQQSDRRASGYAPAYPPR